MSTKARGTHLPHVVEEPRQPSLGRDARIEEFQRPGRRVSRIGERRFARLLSNLIETRKRRVTHVHLAPHFDELAGRLPQRQRNLPDRPQVGGHVVAPPAVAPRDPPGQLSVLVPQAHGEAVDLGLDHVVKYLDVDGLARALVKRHQLLFAVRVVDRQHRPKMRDRLEALFGLSADTLCGGVGRDEIGVRLFETRQITHEAVKPGVCDLRRVADVVQVLMTSDVVPQTPDSLVDIHTAVLGHPRHSNAMRGLQCATT